jgi:DNA-binding MarR family transcriptional regulator
MTTASEVVGATLAPELTRYIVYLMRRTLSQISADTSPRDAAPRDFVALAVLAEQDVFSQQELAERLEINRTIMVKLIDRLQEAGYVTRTRNPSNRRSHVLSLTAGGKKALVGMRRAVAARDRRLTAALNEQEREQLNELLGMLLWEGEKTPGYFGAEYLITQVFYLLRRRGDGMLADIGLRLRHYAPLWAIRKFGPCPQQQVAHYLGITEPAAAQVVEELVQAGLVARGQDPDDRRRYALELTELGQQRFAIVQDVMDQLQAELVKTLRPEGDEKLRALLKKLLD